MPSDVLTVRAFARLQELEPFAQAIDELNGRSRRPCPFSTYVYYRTHVAHDEFLSHSRRFEILFLCAFAGPRLVGYLALRRSSDLFGAKIEFLVTHDTDRPHLVAAPADEAAVARCFMDYLHHVDVNWSLLNFSQQDESTLSLLAGGPKLYVRLLDSVPNSTLHLRWPTLGDYLSETSKKHRQNVARSVRRILSSGHFEHIFSSEPEARERLLEIYMTIEERSWKHVARGTITRDPRRVRFFRTLCQPEQPLALSVHLLCIDGLPIAGMINGAFGQGLYALQIAYDERFAALGPGNLALLLSIEQAITEHRQTFNLLSGFSYYKERWLAQTTPTQTLQIFKTGTIRYGRALLGNARRALRFALTNGVTDHNVVKRAMIPLHSSSLTRTGDVMSAELSRRSAKSLSLSAPTFGITRSGAVELADRLLPSRRD